jgi:hypothetical protein
MPVRRGGEVDKVLSVWCLGGMGRDTEGKVEKYGGAQTLFTSESGVSCCYRLRSRGRWRWATEVQRPTTTEMF